MLFIFRIFSLFSFLLIATSTSFAQDITLDGKILGEENEPIPFANVVLLNVSDSSLHKGVTTDDTGKFQLNLTNKKDYLLQVSSIGYSTYLEKIKSDLFTGAALIIKLEKGKVLEEVYVTAKRPSVERKIDRIVFNVENTLLTTSGSALDVLRKAPQVNVSTKGDNINIRGKDNLIVLINGKRSYIKGIELTDFLKGISASEVSSIEIITNPSSKYDAEGTAGIINIKLKRQIVNGWSSSVNLESEHTKYATNAGGGRLLGKSGGLNFLASVNFRASTQGGSGSTKQYTIENDFDQKHFILYKGLSKNIRLESDYQISKKHYLGASYNTWGNRATRDMKSETNFYSKINESLLALEEGLDREMLYSGNKVNLNYIYDIDTLGQRLELIADYVHKSNDHTDYQRSRNIKLENDDLKKANNDNSYRANIYSFQLDYTLPISDKYLVEAGLKNHLSKLNNVVTLDSLIDNNWLKINELSYDYEHREDIFATYLNLKYHTDKFDFQTGIRAEKTQINGHLIDNDSSFSQKFWKIFPTMFLRQKINDNHLLNYSYAYRLSRAKFNQLFPTRMNTSRFQVYTGNPKLKPVYSHNLELSYTFKNNYNLTLYYISSKGLHDYLTTIEGDKSISTYKNILNSNSFDISISVPLELTKWWSVDNELYYSFSKQYGRYENIIETDETFTSGSYQMSNRLNLPLKINAELSLTSVFPSSTALSKSKSNHWVDVSLQKNIFKDKLELGISFYDIFNTSRWRSSTKTKDFSRIEYSKWYTQSISLSLRYNFNKGESVSIKRKKSSASEASRL